MVWTYDSTTTNASGTFVLLNISGTDQLDDVRCTALLVCFAPILCGNTPEGKGEHVNCMRPE